ncbi:hypothetical protein ACU8KH_00038 [Lachancea thermotolerans]
MTQHLSSEARSECASASPRQAHYYGNARYLSPQLLSGHHCCSLPAIQSHPYMKGW